MQKFINWILFIAMSLIWGSSFLLMKFGMDTLSPYQVASLRICSAGLILLPFAINKIKKFDKKTHLYLFLTGFIGNFLPAY
ncbi:MAG: EamA family transporter, partial [Sediminibacterium sp.]|nr:EamA family transporter [Sediminibacterium sp.]